MLGVGLRRDDLDRFVGADGVAVDYEALDVGAVAVGRARQPAAADHQPHRDPDRGQRPERS